MNIYLFRGEYKEKGETLVKQAIQLYAAEKRVFCAFDLNNIKISRTGSGKPYVNGIPLHFSVSHTGKLWGCAVSSFPVGFDIQEIRKINARKLAERFFLEEEAEFVRKNGDDGFFDIWVRKEACVKYHGTGLGSIRAFSVLRGGEFAKEITYNGGVCLVNQLEPEETGIKCAYCYIVESDEVCVRKLD